MAEMDDSSGRGEDRRLILHLIANDGPAWSYVKDEIVDPLVAADVKGMRNMLARHSIDAESVIGRVYEGLSARNWEVLRNFRFECRFKSFMYWRVYDAVQRLVSEVSRGDGKDPLSLDEPTEGQDGGGIERDPPDPNPMAPVRQMLIGEAVATASEALAKLWAKDPSDALVLLMRNDLDLPTKDVAVLLGYNTFNAVDQVHRRAQEKLRKIRKDIESRDAVAGDVSFYPSSNL